MVIPCVIPHPITVIDVPRFGADASGDGRQIGRIYSKIDITFNK